MLCEEVIGDDCPPSLSPETGLYPKNKNDCPSLLHFFSSGILPYEVEVFVLVVTG